MPRTQELKTYIPPLAGTGNREGRSALELAARIWDQGRAARLREASTPKQVTATTNAPLYRVNIVRR